MVWVFCFCNFCMAQSVLKTMKRLPDTGSTSSYTATPGEDNDYNYNAPYFLLNGDGTVTDTVTGLMWQQTDGGEMKIENAINYCQTLALGGHTDWRLPTAHEAFSILNHQHANPALDNTVFTTSAADYWWTNNRQANDTNKVWVTNAGGGIGNHPRTETISAGGTKKFHVRAVRDVINPSTISNHFIDNGDGTITDNLTNLVWQKIGFSDSLSWEDALHFADTCSYSGHSDWRLPNIKELQSINDESRIGPSINTAFFANAVIGHYWSSTTLPNQTTKAWYLDTQYGITTYALKTSRLKLFLVRGDGSIPIASVLNETCKASNAVFPNPFTNSINIITTEPLTKIEIYDTRAREVLGKNLLMGNGLYKLDLSSLSHGLYYLNTTSVNGQTVCTPIVKE